jgi:epoxyqueuosine reductase QueG
MEVKTMELMEQIKQLGALHGVDMIGVAGLERVKDKIGDISGRIVQDYPRALSIGIRLQNSIVDLLADRESYEHTLQYRTHAYDLINSRLDHFSSIAASMIQQAGYRAMPLLASERIDSQTIHASLSHKLAARLAGFGWIGKNCLLVTPAYGPRVRFTTILTDAPFAENEEIVESKCGSCTKCREICPAQAIYGRAFAEDEPREARLDVKKCDAYFESLSAAGRLKVCGMCLYACPHGRQG